jgi:hypothetical protein
MAGLALLVQLDDASFVKALQGQAMPTALRRSAAAPPRRQGGGRRCGALAASGARARRFASTRRAAKGPMPCSAQKISQAV